MNPVKSNQQTNILPKLPGQLGKMTHRKRETGAQLLARLSSRIDLSRIDPDVFTKVPPSSSSSSASKIIEIYGAEGVGKTEMILHYIAKVCLPSNWNGLSLQGLGAKVIFIDTEFKFSVFRLAIVLEKQILAILENLKKQESKDNDLNMSKNSASSSSADLSIAAERAFNVEKLEVIKENALVGGEGSDACMHKSTEYEGGEDFMNFGKESIDAISKHGGHSSHISDCHGKQESEQSYFEKNTLLTSQEIEDLVQETLGRVQVLRVVSTDQLFISLLELESTLSRDPLLPLVIIDTISAFYWSDKLGDLDNPAFTQSKMSPIANVIARYASDLCITFLVTKSALISNKRVWVDQRDHSKSICASVSTDDQSLSGGVDRSGQMLCEHVEFLGKSWSQLEKKRLVLTRNVDRRGRVRRAVACADWPGFKEFSCTDDGLQFL